MSTNVKNLIRDEYLKNFTTKIKRRCIIVENAKILNSTFQDTLKYINHDVNKIIQLLNIKIPNRQIPFITLVAQFDANLDSRSRIVLRGSNDFDEKVEEQSSLIGTNVSHCIDFIIAEGYKDIKISPIDYDAEIIVSNDYICCAIVDIMLDIAMFNSYSFLKEMSTPQKHSFSYKKFSYFTQNELNSFYECKTNKNLYYSFAFSARRGIDDFDVDAYIKIWNNFIKKNYRKKHNEKTVFQQLKQHVDFHELPQNLAEKFLTMPEGAYLILRTNKDRSIDLKPFICSEFGIEKYEKGKIKIVSINEFDKYKPMLEKLDVSAFKIVNNNSTNPKQNGPNKNLSNNSEHMVKDKSSEHFKIALSFPGEYRALVNKIAVELSNIYGKEAILYDKYHSSKFARPNLDTHLQTLYSKKSDLIVVFNCAEYNIKRWCGIEWRAIRQLLNTGCDERIMLIKCGQGSAEGIFDTVDGNIDASKHSTNELVNLIVERYQSLKLN